MNIIFVHHAERNHTNEFPYNQNDDITKLGEEDAKITAKLLEKASKKLNIMGIYTSPFLRCKHTAEIINKRLHLPVFTDERLNEYRYASREEKWVELQQRVMDTIKDVVFKYDDEPNSAAIMITSGINIAGFINVAYKLDARSDAPFIGIPSTSPLGFKIDKSYFK